MAALKQSEIIIGEGITEKYYFTSLKDILVIKPTPKRLKPYNMDELEKAIKEYAKVGYTKIHCLIDMDNKVRNQAMMAKYQKLKQKYNEKIVRGTDCEVRFYESHPSIELFFTYYFGYSTAENTNDGLKSWLHNKFGYETSEKYLSKPSLHGRFVANGGCLKDAISNANKSVNAREDDNYNCSYTEIGKLIEYLGTL